MNKKINIDDKKIKDEILNLKKTLMNLNFQKSSGQLEKTSKIKDTKKQIARLNTKLSNINGEKNA
jgi:large subunit ribosomal protein L29